MKSIGHIQRSLFRSALILILIAGMSSHASVYATPAGLVSWWPAEGNANDSADANHGTLIGGTTFAPGQVGQAFSLDGAGDFVNLGNASNLHVSASDFTAAAWVNFDSLGSPCGPGPGCDMAILAKMLRVSGRGPNEDGWMIIKAADGHFYFCLGGGPGVNGCAVGIPTTVRSSTIAGSGVWYHVAAVKASSTISIYINGTLEDTKALASFTDTHIVDLKIGAFAPDFGEGAFLDGLVDEVQIYNRALSAAEIQTLINPTPPDTTAPQITATVQGTLGNNGWYRSDVVVSWNVVDDESAISSLSGCDPTTINSDTAGTTLTCTATSDGGTNSESTIIKRDATAPVLNPSVSPNPILLHGSATADAGASDNLSGVSSQSCGALDTSSVGSKNVTCAASDNAGNIASASASYSVIYNFSGFFQPVDNVPTLNIANAGQVIPLKWRLTDVNQTPITNLATVTVTAITLVCPSGATPDQIEEYAAGSSGLQNLGNGYYQFNWKTPKTYARSCKTLRLDLGEASPRIAHFQFAR